MWYEMVVPFVFIQLNKVRHRELIALIWNSQLNSYTHKHSLHAESNLEQRFLRSREKSDL